MKKDNSIHLYFVELGELVKADGFTLKFNEKLMKAFKSENIYRIEIVAEKPDIPVLQAAVSYVLFYTGKAVHVITDEKITPDHLQNAIKLFPSVVGGRWNWMYIGKNEELARNFGIKIGNGD